MRDPGVTEKSRNLQVRVATRAYAMELGMSKIFEEARCSLFEFSLSGRECRGVTQFSVNCSPQVRLTQQTLNSGFQSRWIGRNAVETPGVDHFARDRFQEELPVFPWW